MLKWKCNGEILVSKVGGLKWKCNGEILVSKVGGQQ